MNPWIYKKIKNRQVSDIQRVAYSALILIALANLALIAVAPEAVSLFAPDNYYEAIWVIPPVAMSVFFQFSYSLFANFAFYYEKTKLIATASILGAALNIFLNYVFIPIFGYYAAGYTTLVCYMVYAVFHYCCMRIICRKYMDNVKVYNLKSLLSIAGGFAVVGFLFLTTYKMPVVRYGLLAFSLIVVIFMHEKLIGIAKRIIRIKK